jgi:RecA/RadA recombinase
MSEVHSGELERMPSGIPGLAIILTGGFLKGGLYIVQGPPGTGKTTFGNQVCFHHVASGGRALYVTLLAEYHARMMQHLSVMTFFDGSIRPDAARIRNQQSGADRRGQRRERRADHDGLLSPNGGFFSQSAAAIGPERLAMATVLVVEDEFGIADLIEAVLEDEGHRILMAANGKQGLEMLAQERPDLVFLD